METQTLFKKMNFFFPNFNKLQKLYILMDF
jgi:hypothetical protein